MNAFRSELRKYFTTRLWWGMAIGFVALSMGFSVLSAFFLTMKELPPGSELPTGSKLQMVNSVYTAGMSFGYLLMLSIGVLAIGSEYRHKTISSTLLATPRRLNAMLAKVAALIVIAAGYGVLMLVSSVGAGATVLSLRGMDPFPDPAVFRTFALALLVLGLWALIGMGLGVLIPNQIAALLIGVGVAWIAEPVLGLLLRFNDFTAEYVVPYLPSSATNAVLNVANVPGSHVLAWWAGALVLFGWALLAAVPGVIRVNRQDIS